LLQITARHDAAAMQPPFRPHPAAIWNAGLGMGIGCNMPSISRARRATQLLAIMLAAASLAACARTSSVVSDRSDWRSAPRQTVAHHQPRPVTVVRRHDAPARTDIASAPNGLASFYTEGNKTANGEIFNTHALTAAHPSLPFGTRLRVTNVTNGQSVTVRVNDRGPYVPGRVVDVSYSAAEQLGMVKGGVAKVKLDVVQ
jgi:rare lipoprotein A